MTSQYTPPSEGTSSGGTRKMVHHNLGLRRNRWKREKVANESPVLRDGEGVPSPEVPDETVVSTRRNDLIDDETALGKRQEANDATVAARRKPVWPAPSVDEREPQGADDQTNLATRVKAEPSDGTEISTRTQNEPEDRTVAAARSKVELSDETQMSQRREVTEDATTLSRRRDVDDATVRTRSATRGERGSDDTRLGSRREPSDDTTLAQRGLADATVQSGRRRSKRRRSKAEVEPENTILVSSSAQIAYDPGVEGVAETSYGVREEVPLEVAAPQVAGDSARRFAQAPIDTNVPKAKWWTLWLTGAAVMVAAVVGLVAILTSW